MADVDKKTRLAAARKKLKQLQKVSNQSNSGKPSHNLDHSKNGPVDKLDIPATKNSTEKDFSTTTTTTSNHSTKNNAFLGYSDPSKLNHTQSENDQHSKEKTDPTVVQKKSVYMNGDIEYEANDASKDGHNHQMLKLQNEDLKHQMGKLQLSLEMERKSFEERLRKDVGSLKEQLQVHIETVSILVAEKTELQSTCSQIQKISESRQSEIEELAGRLKASRQRVSDLERGALTLSSTSQKLEKQNKELSKEMDRLKVDVYKNNKAREELQQHNLELQAKLQQKMQELAKVEDSVIDLKGKQEMSEVYIEQLKSGQSRPDSNVSKQIEMILTEKTQLQTQVQMQEDSLKLMTREREAMASQYNDYVQQLSSQNDNLHQQVELIVRERDVMKERMDQLEEECKQLMSKQAEANSEQLHVHEEKSRLLGDVEELMAQLMSASAALQRQKEDNGQLSSMLAEKEQQLLSMEMKVERMSGNKVDSEKLLDEMNSDKSALSRAVGQNKQLKSQFVELQEQFVKISQKNMELTTRLQAEEHKCKGSQQRLGLQEDEIKELKASLDTRARYISELENTVTDLKSSSSPTTTSSSSATATTTSSPSLLEQDKMAELFRLKVPLIESLQKELSSAQDTVNALTNQNSELKEKLFLSEQTPPALRDAALNQATISTGAGDEVSLLQTEKANLSEQLCEALKVQDLLRDKIDMIQHDIALQAPAMINGDLVNKVNFEALQHAMRQLEEKYSRVMRDKAEMLDANERLEHIVMQLQGETDTIGEYVSLYQHQRHLMRQRVVEKDSLIEQLCSERRHLQGKLQQLQSLLLQLLNEGGGVSVAHVSEHLNGMVGSGNRGGGGGVGKVGRSTGRKRKMLDAEERKKAEGEWPHYSESSEEEEEEAIDQSEGTVPLESPTSATTTNQWQATPPTLFPTNKNIPRDSNTTVSKIMSLLSEISVTSSSSASPELFRMSFFCKNCIGDILVI